MPPTIVLDTTDATDAHLRGWGRYVDLLARELGPEVVAVRAPAGSRRPELVWEQAGLPRALARRGADLVHAPNCFLPLRRPCPGVVTIHDLAFEAFPEDFAPRTRWKYRTFAPLAARSAERVIVPSRATLRDVVERYGVSEGRVSVIPEAPALPLGDDPAPEGGYLLAVGDLRAKKNLRVLVEAARRLGTRVVLAGLDAGDGAELAGPGVTLAGYVGDRRLDALMRGADALVHPSLYEGFGLVVLEAMARGTPVVCADATALPETAGGAAELFDPSDPAALVAALERVLADPDRYAAAGRAHAATFSWAETARRTRAVYEELL